ncbi:MAG: hypothetical protein HY721_34610 [Planctomycetes bacterium]|nr:hypothetical protein [Planctomycetota bacterium]
MRIEKDDAVTAPAAKLWLAASLAPVLAAGVAAAEGLSVGEGRLRLADLACLEPEEPAPQSKPEEKSSEERRIDRRRRGEETAPPAAPKAPEDKPRGEPPSRPAGELAAEPPPGTTADGGKHFEPVDSRWFRSFPSYEINEPGDKWYDPYRQSLLKGDYPILGEDVFLALTLTDRVLVEGRRVPTPTGISGEGGFDFFGDGEQLLVQNFAVATVDLFKGQQAFKPIDWRLKASLAYNNTYLEVQEVGVVNVDVDRGRTRYSDYLALQEAVAEIHLLDVSSRYDFLSFEAGIIPFRSDFRGFIFDDTNLGARFFGNADENKWQYNVTAFHLLEKDTNSELNRLEERDQEVIIVNCFRQDWPVLGYTPSLSFHYNHDDDERHFDRNGFLVRPAPVGFARPHEVEAYYAGLVGEGHIGRINVSHAYFHAFGEDQDNPFAARDVDINAYMAALELSYDIDWLRLRGFGLYSSGDDDVRDSSGEGFDAIVDSPNFAGGQFSFFNRQAIKLLGVNLVNRNSFLPDLTTSKFEGQSNFVNPGLLLLGGAVDVEITPTWRAQVGSSYLRFLETEPLEVFLEVEKVDKSIGVEVFFGTQYRPLLTNNVVATLGFAPFFPGAGFRKIYQSSEVLFSAFFDLTLTY